MLLVGCDDIKKDKEECEQKTTEESGSKTTYLTDSQVSELRESARRARLPNISGTYNTYVGVVSSSDRITNYRR